MVNEGEDRNGISGCGGPQYQKVGLKRQANERWLGSPVLTSWIHRLLLGERCYVTYVSAIFSTLKKKTETEMDKEMDGTVAFKAMTVRSDISATL